jgi:type IV secretory pathway VirB4 component
MFAGQNNSALVLGKSGSGKSVSMMTIAVREGYRGTRAADGTILPTSVMAIDHSGEWQAAMDLLGGRCVSLGRDALNVFGLGLGADAREAAVLVAPTLAIMSGDETCAAAQGSAMPLWLDRAGQALLKTALLSFLARRSSMRDEPLLSDFVGHLLDAAADARDTDPRAATQCEEMAGRLRDYTLPPLDAAFDRPSSFNLADGVSTAVGVGELGDLVGGNLTAVYAMVLMAFRRLLRCHAGRVILVIDDAHPLMVNRYAADILNDTIRECRKFDGAVMVGSQQPEDFFENPVGRVLAGNSETKIIGALDTAVASSAAAPFGLGAEYVSLLTQLTRRQAGTVVLSTPQAACAMRFTPGPLEPYLCPSKSHPRVGPAPQ